MRTTAHHAVLLPLFLVACSPGSKEGAAGAPFPADFLFGSATAGFQVEMGCPTMPAEECVDANSDWYDYVTDPGVLAIERLTLDQAGDPATTGPGHWELYGSDYDLARDVLHNDAFRLGIEWSRIFPTATDELETHEELRAAADLDALAHYRRMLEALRDRGMTPLVNLHHYTLPTWIHDGAGCTIDFASCTERGWLDRERIGREMAKYAGFVARELGDRVDLWATQNEPFAVLMSGYLMQTTERSNPPALQLDAAAARTVLTSMVEAHARVVDAVRANDDADADGDGAASSLGMVHAMAPAIPDNPSNPLDQRAADNAFYLWNLVLLDAVARGELDDDLDGEAIRRDDLAGRLDWIGLNYKQSMVVAGTRESILPELSPLLTIDPTRLDLSQIHPRGLYEMVWFLERRYGLPIYVTENNGRQLWRGDEELEARYVAENLQWLARAVEEGADVRGYFYWSFLDNYEWNHGMSVRLGLFAVDPADPAKARAPRDIARLYGRIAGERAVPADLTERYPIDFGGPPTGGVPDGSS